MSSVYMMLKDQSNPYKGYARGWKPEELVCLFVNPTVYYVCYMFYA